MKSPALLFTTFAVALLAFPPAARAATIITNGSDAELRAAVANCGTITFAFNGIITLTNAIDVSCDVTIDATGHSVVLSGSGSNRLFSVLPGASLNLVQLTIANGRVRGTNGHDAPPQNFFVGGQPGESVQGGGILVSNGLLSAASCIFSNCSLAPGNGGNAGTGSLQYQGPGGAATGGAIAARNSTVQLRDCLFVANSASAGLSGLGQFANDNTRTPGTGTGGAIDATASVMTITNCQFAGNSTTSSGGAINTSGNSSSNAVAHSTFRQNVSGISGGAVSLGSGALTLHRCVVLSNSVVGSDNYSSMSGGAAAVGGTASISDCDFAFNRCLGAPGRLSPSGVGVNATSGEGGAVAVLSGGTLSGSRSTFRNNSAQGGNGAFASPFPASPALARGGAILQGGPVRLTNCTLVLNTAMAGSGPGAFSSTGSGGAIHGSGTLTLASCTIVSNRVTGDANSRGGGVSLSNLGMAMHTILQSNYANATQDNALNLGDGGNNLSSDATPNWNGGSRNNIDAQLLPLAHNGGFTMTMALRSGSPALNAGNPTNLPAIDQRGVPRPRGAGPDIGAWEGPDAPNLAIHRGDSSHNVLRWQGQSGESLRLDTSSNLLSWMPFATNHSETNGWIELVVPVDSTNRFFRLAVP